MFHAKMVKVGIIKQIAYSHRDVSLLRVREGNEFQHIILDFFRIEILSTYRILENEELRSNCD